MISKQYNLKVKQPTSEVFDNIENEYIKETIEQSTGLTIENNVLSKDTLSSENDRIFICSDVCASYNTESSIEDISVPVTDKYYFLSKLGSEYKFLKDRPLPNRYLNDNDLLGFNGIEYSDLMFNPEYRNYVQVSIETLGQQSFGSDAYRCFSFNFGGISKTSSVFYTVDSNNTLTMIDVSSEDYLVDYVEGNIYLRVSENTDIVTMIIGLFNIDPIIVDRKGNLKLTETNSTFYKFLNNADKGNISIKLLNTKYILSSIDNIYIYSDNEDLLVDGIRLETGYKLYVPKNTKVVLELGYNDILIDDYVSNTSDVTVNNANYSSPTNGDHLNENNIVTYPLAYTSVYIIKEIEKNTYNFDRPSILSLRNFNIG